jgi:hypothetical protein
VNGAQHRQRGDRIERELVEETHLLRDWLAWHREEPETVLAGEHGAMFERLLYILKTLTLKSAPLLLAYIRGIDWSSVDSPTRLIVLHEVNSGITNLRTRHTLRRSTTASSATASVVSSANPHKRRRPGRSPV